MLAGHGEIVAGSSESDRIRSARKGDPVAMNALMVILAPMLRRCAQRQIGNDLRARMDASDVAQGALLEAARDLPSFVGSTLEELSAWARGILRRNVLDHVKAQVRAKKRDVNAERPLEQEPPTPLTSPSQKVARREQFARIAGFAAELPDPAPHVVEMWLSGHSVREMAAALGKTDQSIASLLKRALEHVRARAAKAKW